ncbi:MAG: DNA repair protein RecN [Burkholderiaceae bacterium]
MLLALSIRDFVIVDSLELDLAPGFTVLTGETGAGKSILIDALLLALGERADAGVVRESAARAEIVAEFATHPSALEWLAANELGAEPTALLRRVVDASGRSRAWINGTPATLAQLREIGELLVDVHGQHAHQSLLKPAAQLALLDEHGGLRPQVATVLAAHGAWRKTVRAREAAQQMAAAAAAEQDRLRWIVDDLGELEPQSGEWEQVNAEQTRLAHAASLLEGTQQAITELSDADDSALGRIDAISARLAQLSVFDERLKPIAEQLEAARIQVDDAVGELQHYIDKTDIDAERLAAVDARLSALHGAARKFRVAPDELGALLDDGRAKLAALSAAADLDALARTEKAASDTYLKLARALGQARAKAAAAMSLEVSRAMQDLSMPGGRFEVQLSAGEPSAHGLERCEFMVASHPGVAVKLLAKVASGGELARISLAISVIAAGATPVATLIFDEVDSGIGGAVADTVGRLLKELGSSRQVLCVTHLPQVASRGDQHLVVSKACAGDGRPVSRIAPLDRKTRVEEIARMLGGLAITDTTRKHAREMLAG